jgi:hypothetical protein
MFRSKKEIRENEAELRNLGIQLKAIEVLCDSMLPSDRDPDLLASIKTWRADWVALKYRMSARRKARHSRGNDDDDITITTITTP